MATREALETKQMAAGVAAAMKAPAEPVRKRDASDAMLTAERSAAATNRPMPTMKKMKTAAEAAAATKAPTKPATTRNAQEAKRTAASTAAATEAPATPLTKKKKRTAATITERKITFAQFQR